MKHWHLCERWIRRGIACPFTGVELGGPSGGDPPDDLPPVAFPLPVPAPPILPPATAKQRDKERKEHERRGRGGCDLIPCPGEFPRPVTQPVEEPDLPVKLPPRPEPAQPVRPRYEVPEDPPEVEEVLRQMDRNIEEYRGLPEDPPDPEPIHGENISGPGEGPSYPELGAAEEVAAEYAEIQRINTAPPPGAGAKSDTLQRAKEVQKGIRKGVSGRGVSGPRRGGGPPGFFNAARRMRQLMGRSLPRTRRKHGENISGPNRNRTGL